MDWVPLGVRDLEEGSFGEDSFRHDSGLHHEDPNSPESGVERSFFVRCLVGTIFRCEKLVERNPWHRFLI